MRLKLSLLLAIEKGRNKIAVAIRTFVEAFLRVAIPHTARTVSETATKFSPFFYVIGVRYSTCL